MDLEIFNPAKEFIADISMSLSIGDMDFVLGGLMLVGSIVALILIIWLLGFKHGEVFQGQWSNRIASITIVGVLIVGVYLVVSFLKII